MTNATGVWLTNTYNSTDGTLSTRLDAGGTTSYGYDSYGQLSVITFPGSLGSEGFLNTALGDMSSHTNARGFITSFQYDKRRELTNTIAPTNLISSVGYDAVGNVLSTTDPRSNGTTNTWSPTRKLMATAFPTTPQGVPVITNVYDVRDWISRSERRSSFRSAMAWARSSTLVIDEPPCWFNSSMEVQMVGEAGLEPATF